MATVSLTRAQAKTLAKTLMDEKGALFWTDTQMNALFDEANRIVWRMLVKANPGHYHTSTNFAWPADTEIQDIVSDCGVAAVPYKILGIESKETAGSVTSANLPAKWKPMMFQDRTKFLQDSSPYWVPRGRYYCLRGTKLFVAPLPGEALQCTIYYVQMLDKVTSDATECLGGMAESFHDSVAYCLAWLMNSKQNGQNPTIDRLWESSKLEIEQHAEEINADEPRQVRYIGHH